MNPFVVLGITRDASTAEIKEAYKKTLLKHHPDKVLLQARGTQLYTIDDINLAYKEVLSEREESGIDSVEIPVVSYNEVCDLDEMDFDGAEKWTKKCRCGLDGYVLTVPDLEVNGDAQEISLQCSGCSLWILVQYAVEEG